MYKIIKNKDNKTYRVVNVLTKKVHARATTLTKAEKQIRLMEYLDDKNNPYHF